MRYKYFFSREYIDNIYIIDLKTMSYIGPKEDDFYVFENNKELARLIYELFKKEVNLLIISVLASKQLDVSAKKFIKDMLDYYLT